MKAIRTRYHGATNTRGSRIIASDGDGNRASIPYPHELNSEEAHRKAALALCAKMGWNPAGLVTGWHGADAYHVWAR